MAELIVLTCASGKQCSKIIPPLYEQSSRYRLRLVVHSITSLERLQKEYPNAEVVQARLDNLDDCAKILDGATVMFYIGPTFHVKEEIFGLNVIDASIQEAQKPNTKFVHFIYSSVLHVLLRKHMNHEKKRNVEEYLVESPINWTILEPSHLMDNTINRILSLKDSPESVYIATQNPEVSFSFSCVHDFAKCSIKVIMERSKHFFATYQLVSTWPMKYKDYIQSVGSAIGKNLTIREAPYSDVIKVYCKNIFGAEEVDLRSREGPARMLLYYSERGLIGNPRISEWLLGRPTTSPEALAKILLGTSTAKSS